MKDNFLKHFAIIGTGTFLGMLLGFLTTPIITRIVPPNDYGRFSIFTMYSNIAIMVLYLGLDQSMVRYFYDDTSDKYRQGLLCKCIKYPIIGTVITILGVLLLSFADVFKFELGFSALILMCVYIFIQIIYRFSLLLIRLQYKSKLYSILGVVQKICYIGFALPLVFGSAMDKTISLALATVLAALLCLVISVMAEHKIWNFTSLDCLACPIPQKELLKYAYPYVFSMGVTTLFQYIDKMSLNIYCSYEEVGIYSSTMTLVHVFSIIQTTFNTLWAPMAVEHYTQNSKDVSFYQKGNQIITVIMFLIGFSLIFAKDVFAILLGAKYREAAYILPFLIFNPIMYTVSETTVNGLVFMKKSKMQVIISLGSCVTNIIGNAMLVPRFGCRGAAISTGISYIVFFTLRTLVSNKFFYIDFHLKKFYIVTLLAVGYAFYNTFFRFSGLSVVGYIICIVILVILYKDTVLFGINYLKNIVIYVVKNKHKF